MKNTYTKHDGSSFKTSLDLEIEGITFAKVREPAPIYQSPNIRSTHENRRKGWAGSILIKTDKDLMGMDPIDIGIQISDGHEDADGATGVYRMVYQVVFTHEPDENDVWTFYARDVGPIEFGDIIEA